MSVVEASTSDACGSGEFWVHCRCCAHEWIAAYTPMPVEKFLKIGSRCICPKCGETKDLRIGRAEPMGATSSERPA
jgi:hypothetical protein